jgi:hypothetical protein
MAFDYTEFADLSAELIEEFGRPITLIELGDVPEVGAQPWLGADAPRTAVAATLSTFGVFVEPSVLERLGESYVTSDFLKRATQIALVYAATDISQMDEIIEADGARNAITGVSRLRPATTDLLWFVGTAR